MNANSHQFSPSPLFAPAHARQVRSTLDGILSDRRIFAGRVRTLVHHLNKSKMATASHMIHNSNAACCSIPPVESEYTPQGRFSRRVQGHLFTSLRQRYFQIGRRLQEGLCHWWAQRERNRLRLRHLWVLPANPARRRYHCVHS